MSLRALGRQFVAHARDAAAGRHYWPGTESHPQGRLFLGGGGRQSLFDPDVKEAGRRRVAGEANPDAPWRTPIFQHHFQTRPQPVWQKLPGMEDR